MRFLPFLVLVGLTLIGLSLAAPNLRACSCKSPPPPKEAMEKMAAVFSGKAVKLEADEKAHEVHVTFEVSRVWKGEVGKTITVTTGGGTCGFRFHEGDGYLVYAYDQGEQLKTNICTRTRVLAHAKEDLEALGEGKAVDAGSATAPPATRPSHQATGRAKALKAAVKNFALVLSYTGPQDKPYYDLNLHVAPMHILQNDAFHLYVQITEGEAVKVIDYLATDGFLGRATDPSNGADHQAVLIGPVYLLTTLAESPTGRTEFYENLGWDMKMLGRLDGLRAVLDGEAAKQIDVLLGRLVGERKAWEKAGGGKKAENPEKDFVTLDRIPSPEEVLEMRNGDGKHFVAAEGPLPESFRKALATAKPLDAADRSIRTWAYSPAERGTFKTKDGTYRFTLFLGERGQLTTPSGKVGMFSYEGTANLPPEVEAGLVKLADPKVLFIESTFAPTLKDLRRGPAEGGGGPGQGRPGFGASGSAASCRPAAGRPGRHERRAGDDEGLRRRQGPGDGRQRPGQRGGGPADAERQAGGADADAGAGRPLAARPAASHWKHWARWGRWRRSTRSPPA